MMPLIELLIQSVVLILYTWFNKDKMNDCKFIDLNLYFLPEMQI